MLSATLTRRGSVMAGVDLPTLAALLGRECPYDAAVRSSG
jgi:hypothetical protein